MLGWLEEIVTSAEAGTAAATGNPPVPYVFRNYSFLSSSGTSPSPSSLVLLNPPLLAGGIYPVDVPTIHPSSSQLAPRETIFLVNASSDRIPVHASSYEFQVIQQGFTADVSCGPETPPWPVEIATENDVDGGKVDIYSMTVGCAPPGERTGFGAVSRSRKSQEVVDPSHADHLTRVLD